MFFFQLFARARLVSSLMALGIKFVIMSFISSKFVAIEEIFFEHPSYVVFLQITYLAMAFEYMAKILAMVF
jgi:hypothetical protein